MGPKRNLPDKGVKGIGLDHSYTIVPLEWRRKFMKCTNKTEKAKLSHSMAVVCRFPLSRDIHFI
jgi:hypothetical protein